MQTTDKFAAAKEKFSLAAKASREHDQLAEKSFLLYGDHGAHISGIVRDHFPDDVKNRLRMLAHDVSRLNDEGFALRPKYTRFTTMLAIARDVVRLNGGGYYGIRV